MRKSRQDAAATRRHIVEAAATVFRERGIHAAGLSDVMAAAGLTHGGFYRHFVSKDDLLAEACAAALAEMGQSIAAAVSQMPEGTGLKAVAAKYLSAGHRDHPALGCPLAALGSELARADWATRDGITAGLGQLVGLLADPVDPADRAATSRAMADLATMVGALTLARIVTDDTLSRDILAAARHAIARP